MEKSHAPLSAWGALRTSGKQRPASHRAPGGTKEDSSPPGLVTSTVSSLVTVSTVGTHVPMEKAWHWGRQETREAAGEWLRIAFPAICMS